MNNLSNEELLKILYPIMGAILQLRAKNNALTAFVFGLAESKGIEQEKLQESLDLLVQADLQRQLEAIEKENQELAANLDSRDLDDLFPLI